MRLIKQATVLQGRGYPQAMSMSPRQIYFTAAVLAEEDRRELLNKATAVRLAQADKNGWEKALKALGDE